LTRDKMLALTSATGKLGSAVISAILENKLIDPKHLVICVRSFPSPHPIFLQNPILTLNPHKKPTNQHPTTDLKLTYLPPPLPPPEAIPHNPSCRLHIALLPNRRLHRLHIPLPRLHARYPPRLLQRAPRQRPRSAPPGRH